MNRSKPIFTILMLIIVMSACNFPGATSSEDVQRAAAETIAAQVVDAVVDAPATDVPSDNNDGSSNPTNVPTPTNVPPPTAIPPTETAETACDLAGFIKDVTVPDGKKFAPGDVFTKTWRLVNNGSCDWTSGYQLVFFSGDQMSGPSSQQLTNGLISPGQTLDISVSLTAPGTDGTYKGNWKIKNPAGQLFALNGSVPFFVEIKVVEPTATDTPALVVDFTAGYAGAWTCDTQYKRSFKITNTGDLTIQSMQITLEGPIGNYLNGFSNNAPFRPVPPPEPMPDCKQAGTSSLGVGNVSWVGVHTTSPPPAGTSSRAIIKMCSQDNLGGSCKEVIVNFTW